MTKTPRCGSILFSFSKRANCCAIARACEFKMERIEVTGSPHGSRSFGGSYRFDKDKNEYARRWVYEFEHGIDTGLLKHSFRKSEDHNGDWVLCAVNATSGIHLSYNFPYPPPKFPWSPEHESVTGEPSSKIIMGTVTHHHLFSVTIGNPSQNNSG